MKAIELIQYVSALAQHVGNDADVTIELMVGKQLVVLPIEDVALRNKTNTITLTVD